MKRDGRNWTMFRNHRYHVEDAYDRSMIYDGANFKRSSGTKAKTLADKLTS